MSHPLTPAALEAQLRRMRAQVAGSAVPGDTEYFAVPEPGQLRAPGAIATLLGATFVKMRTGLFVPQHIAASPTPLDLVKVYITSDELLGWVPTADDIAVILRRVPLERVIEFAAGLLNAMGRPGATLRELDMEFVERHLLDRAKVVAQQLLRDEKRALVAPQVIYVLLKRACVTCPDEQPDGTTEGNYVAALIGLTALLGSDEELEPTVVTGPVSRIGRELIANQLFNTNPHAANLIGRFVRCWMDLPEELAGRPRVRNMAAEFEAATGVQLGDFAAVGIALWSASVNLTPRVTTDYFAGLRWDTARLARVLKLLTIDLDDLRDLVADEIANFGMEWSISTFERFPVMRMGNGDLLVLDPKLLLKRVFGLLPMFDIKEGFRSQGQQRRMPQVWASFEYLAEQYALETLRSAVPAAAAARVYDDTDLDRVARGKKADAAIDYGDAWVVVEVTTSRPQRGSVSGTSKDEVEADLDKLVEEVRQIDATINDIRERESDLTGKDSTTHRRFHPVLVVTEGFPINPVTATHLRERVTAAGLLQHADTGLLEVFDAEQLEMVEAIAESGGPSLVDLLRGHEASGLMANVGLRDYVIHLTDQRVGTSTRLDEALARLTSALSERIEDTT